MAKERNKRSMLLRFTASTGRAAFIRVAPRPARWFWRDGSAKPRPRPCANGDTSSPWVMSGPKEDCLRFRMMVTVWCMPRQTRAACKAMPSAGDERRRALRANCDSVSRARPTWHRGRAGFRTAVAWRSASQRGLSTECQRWLVARRALAKHTRSKFDEVARVPMTSAPRSRLPAVSTPRPAEMPVTTRQPTRPAPKRKSCVVACDSRQSLYAADLKDAMSMTKRYLTSLLSILA